jgi:hypothetical protein
MEDLAKKYQGRAQFLFIYGREAHADSSQTLASFQAEGHLFPDSLRQTQDRTERAEYAAYFRRQMKGGVRRILVDEDGENNVQAKYLAGVRLLVLVDRNQRIVLSSQYLPLPLLDETLQRLLQEGSPGPPAGTGASGVSTPP